MTLHVSYKYTCDFCGAECAERDEFKIPAAAALPRPQEGRRLGYGHACYECYKVALKAIDESGRYDAPRPP